MVCYKITDNLYQYIYNELDDDTNTAIKEHLDGCEKCNAEYNELKQLLITDAAPLIKARESIEVPQDLTYRVKSKLQIRIKVKPIKYLIAACLTIVFLYTAPVFAYYVASVFPFEKYVHFLDKGVIQDFKEGRGQVIGKSSTMKDVTFTVDGMVKRDNKFSIIFTIKVPKNDKYNYGMPPGGANIITVQDQSGRSYRVGSAAGSSEMASGNGEFQYIFDIDEPLSFWSYKLNIRLTAIELGYTNESENRYFEKYKNIYGNWNVDFNINRSIEKE